MNNFKYFWLFDNYVLLKVLGDVMITLKFGGTSMGNAVRSGMNGVISKVQNTINKGIGLINSAITLANKLPGIKVGKVGKLSLPRLAKGGVLEQGQIGLLEGSGAEAVVPLENNRAWLSRLAEDLNEIQQTNGRMVSDEALIQRLNRIIELLEKLLGMNIYLDSDVLVGELAPAMDARLGKIYNRTNRKQLHKYNRTRLCKCKWNKNMDRPRRNRTSNNNN